jgi:hypothetical protein
MTIIINNFEERFLVFLAKYFYYIFSKMHKKLDIFCSGLFLFKDL